MSKKSSKDKTKQAEPQVESQAAKPIEPPKAELPNPALFESKLEVGRSGHVNRTNFDDSNLNKFILQNGLHGKVTKIIAEASMEPVNGNLITKYTIYRKG